MKSIQGEIELFNNMASHGLMWVFIKKQISSPVKNYLSETFTFESIMISLSGSSWREKLESNQIRSHGFTNKPFQKCFHATSYTKNEIKNIEIQQQSC